MNRIRHALALLTAALLAFLIASCGGGSQVAGGGTGGTGISMGTVSGFGSVFVNGVRYNTDSAEITADGQTVTDERTDLGRGMVVRVEAKRLANGTWSAMSIEYRSDMRGPIADIDASLGSFTVFGRSVRVTTATHYSGIASLSDVALANGDFVEVSGFADGAGGLVATRVESDGNVWLAGDAVDLRGFVDSVGVLDLVVEGVDVTASSLGNVDVGDFVHVTGKWDLASSKIYDATIVVENYDLNADEGDEIELEGIATRLVGTQLIINNIPVEAADAELEGLGGLADAVGQRVEAEGRFTGGRFVAKEIELEIESDIELRAEVQGWDADSGTVTLLGKAFHVTAQTSIEEKASFFGDLTVGMLLSVHAYRGGTGGDTYFATEVELEGSGLSTVELQGVVDAKDVVGSTVTVAGVLVHLDAGDVPGGDVAVYLASLVTGTSVVEVTGTESPPGEIAADTISGP